MILPGQNLENATIFQMATTPLMSKIQAVIFTEIASNRTLQAVHQDPKDCPVGNLQVAEGQNDSSLFRIYDHLSEDYFTQNPECCV